MKENIDRGEKSPNSRNSGLVFLFFFFKRSLLIPLSMKDGF